MGKNGRRAEKHRKMKATEKGRKKPQTSSKSPREG
jgi:hypothetical protein